MAESRRGEHRAVSAFFAKFDVMTPVPVTAIILTQDEEINIARCLSALHRFDEVIVVDSGSQDRTLEIVREQFPQTKIYEHPFENFGDQRNWALDQTTQRNGWVLFIDADEFMEDPLADEISSFVQSPGDHVGGFIAGRNHFMGRWLKRCTFYPSYQLRLLQRGKVRYRKEGHGQREVMDGTAIYLKTSWYHDAFSHGIHQWIDRHNRYSSDEVELILRLRKEPLQPFDLFGDRLARRRVSKRLLARLPGRAFVRIFFTYFVRLGFLDGRAGFWFCVLRFTHECHIMAKLAEVHSRSQLISRN